MNNATLIICAIGAAILFGLYQAVDHYRSNAIAYKEQRDQVTKSLAQANAIIIDMQTRQRDVSVLDAKYTKELADAKAKNDALQRKLYSGSRVLVEGHCPVPTASETTGTSSLGNDIAVELSSTAGRNVLSIRAGIISDQTALRALQEYISTQCLK